MQILEPVRQTEERPGGAEGQVIRSHLLMRTVIGGLGLALPVFLVLGDLLFLDNSVSARGSLSAYYHSGMRDIFVGILGITGLALFTYKLFEKNLDNTLSIAAGIAVLGVALFPTKLPSDVDSPLTPLQDHLGETAVSTIHYVSAIVFIGSLLVLTIFFGIREGTRPRGRAGVTTARSPEFWKTFHLSAALVIAAGIAIIAFTQVFNVWDEHSLLVGESLAVWGFGASWLMKGLEIDLLIGRKVAQ